MKNRTIFLSIVAAMGVISSTLCAPALPFIAERFTADISSIQFAISLFLVGNACGQLLAGPLSDKVGQKSVLLGGLWLYLLASCGCALSWNMGSLITARFMQGMGSAMGPVLTRAIAASSFNVDRSAQVQSYGALSVGVASILAILSSGQLTLFSWRGNFWLAASLGALLLIWATSALKNFSGIKAGHLSIKQWMLHILGVLRNPIFLGSTLCHAMTYGLMYGYIALFPFILKELFQETSPMQVAIYSAYMIAFYMLGAFVAARCVLRFQPYRLIICGVLLQCIAGCVLVFSIPLFLFLSALFVFNFSIGIILPMTSATALAPFAGKGVGFASSTLGLSYRFLGSFLSVCICQLPLASFRNMGIAIIALSSVSLCMFLWLTPKRSLSI